jgi:hypothetical protein
LSFLSHFWSSFWTFLSSKLNTGVFEQFCFLNSCFWTIVFWAVVFWAVVSWAVVFWAVFFWAVVFKSFHLVFFFSCYSTLKILFSNSKLTKVIKKSICFSIYIPPHGLYFCWEKKKNVIPKWIFQKHRFKFYHSWSIQLSQW